MKQKYMFIAIVMITFILLLSACGASSVVERIDNLGEINETTGQELQKIKEKYDELSDKQKDKVTNYAQFVAKTEEYESYLRILSVKDSIASIGEMSLDTKDVLDEIKSKYDALSDSEKSKVDNYDHFVALEIEFEEYMKYTIADIVDDLDWYEYNERNSKAEKLFDYYDYMSDSQKRECLALHLFYEEAPDYVKNTIKNSLKNPSSFTLYDIDVESVLTYDEDDDEFTGWIDITYGGTNSFGGMVKESESVWVDFSVDIETKRIYFNDITIWGF